MEAAAEWIGTLHLARNLDGQTVDLSQAGATLPYEGRFRDMVLEAVRRKLKKRGAKEIILPPKP